MCIDSEHSAPSSPAVPPTLPNCIHEKNPVMSLLMMASLAVCTMVTTNSLRTGDGLRATLMLRAGELLPSELSRTDHDAGLLPADDDAEADLALPLGLTACFPDTNLSARS